MDLQPLWPGGQRIEIIGLTGEFSSGKTLFGLTIDPSRTLMYDLEKSGATYSSLGFTRCDFARDVMMPAFPNGYTPKDLFVRWLAHVRSLKPGQHRVIMLDPVSEIESGLCDWVRDNPQTFGHTVGQYQKMEGLFWGDVKDHWKMILNDIASRCECFVFTSHMRNVWSRSGPTGKRQAKGKETLMELASLYLQMERKADAKGNVPAVPSAVVLKSRLATTKISDKGEIEVLPILPPRMPIATPGAIRLYITNPPDYSKLRKTELAPEEQMTEDDRLQMKLAVAEAERDSEMARLERLHKTEKRIESASVTPPASTPLAQQLAASIDQVAETNGKISRQQLNELSHYKNELVKHGLTDDQWRAIVKKRGVEKAMDLTKEQAHELIGALGHRLDTFTMEKESAALGRPKSARTELAVDHAAAAG